MSALVDAAALKALVEAQRGMVSEHPFRPAFVAIPRSTRTP